MPESPETADGSALPQPQSVRAPAAPPRPTIADGETRQLDPRSVTASRVGGSIFAGILAAVTLVATTINLLVMRPALPVTLAVVIGWITLNGAVLCLIYLWPAVAFRYTSYVVDERGLRIRRGVVWRSDLVVPQTRVQHTDVSQGPIKRAFGVASLIVHTAGTENASVSLGGLEVETAYRIRDYLIEGGENDAV
ncbi:MAG: PH domain-containing protein [bacterium]|nr:PH domain-containing protein [bacterium]